ncbi:MAG: YbaB/EbfC family nucleoid-associated protein [Cyclobacteriaceae bacterium]
MFDMMKMMGKMKEVQARLKEAQDNLVHVQAHGESGGGMVKATVNGKRQLIELDVDPSLLKSDDKIVLQDLIIAAVNKATEEADIRAKEELRKSTEGLLPNIPGMDFSGMMG